MKFKVTQDPFLKGISKVSGVIPSRTPLTFLYNVHAVLEGNKLTLTGSDGDVFLITNVTVEGQEDGSVLVPARPLQELLRELPEAEIEVETTEDQHLLISTEKGRFNIPGEDPSRYPPAPEDKPPQKISFSPEELKSILDQTVFAVSHDELRPALTGLLLQFKTNEMRAVSTDGHRLVKLVKQRQSDETSAADDVEVIVPLKTLNLLQKNLEEVKSVDIFLATNRVVFDMDDMVITSKVVEGKFPSYDAVIPKDVPNKLLVDVGPLIASVKRVSIFANQINRLVVFKVTSDKIGISAEDPDSGRKAQEEIEATFEGDDLEIGYNANYLLEALRHVPDESIIVNLGTSTSAGLIRPNETKEGEELLMLLMPIRLQ
ncbi:DNA polymerase III subunit beta [candidate division LCP-89 bacterium B3_LCP]|uniref:Beta sliding clamp n=1 Tax=candidate division LCP-89 bacterium B3_LCP TaxID=2012998 RepID=A0A532V569_UNCL8|nr:MAG: DNA polymerase III subunit beta [candidate division LCP-89 bacterium B3_LCP]